MPKKPSARATSKSSKLPLPRLPFVSLDALAPEQQALVDAIKASPREQFNNEGPFAVYLHAPA